MAKGTLRKKIPQLKLALEGKVTQHHHFLLKQWLDMLDFLDDKIEVLKKQIVEKSRPFEATVQTWMKVPGLRRINAYSLLAEIGADMKQFPTAGDLASWAAICPENRESAGKQTSGKIRKGNPWLKRTLCEAGWAASRTKNSYFRALYRRLVRGRGKNRALIAVAHTLLVTVYSFTLAGEPYRDLGLDYFDLRNKDQLERSLVKRLEKFGRDFQGRGPEWRTLWTMAQVLVQRRISPGFPISRQGRKDHSGSMLYANGSSKNSSDTPTF